MKTTIGEVIKQMEKATEFMNGQRLSVGDMHGDVVGAIRPIAESVGLECRGCWDICIPDGYGRSQTIMKYDVDFTEDKRYRNKRVGTLHKLVFNPAQDYISLDDTVEQAVTKINYINAKANHERLQKELADLYKQVDDYKGYVEETGKEMNELYLKVQEEISK